MSKQPGRKYADSCGCSSMALGDKVQREFLVFMMQRTLVSQNGPLGYSQRLPPRPSSRCGNDGVVADEHRPSDGLQALGVAPINNAGFNVDDGPDSVRNQSDRILAVGMKVKEFCRNKGQHQHKLCILGACGVVPQDSDGDWYLQSADHLRG